MNNTTTILSTKTLTAVHRQAFIDVNIDLFGEDFINTKKKKPALTSSFFTPSPFFNPQNGGCQNMPKKDR